MINNKEKMSASVDWENDKLVVRINDQIVRSLVPNSQKPYKFTYKGEVFHFIYEKTPQTERVFFYPLNEYEQRIISLKEDGKT